MVSLPLEILRRITPEEERLRKRKWFPTRFRHYSVFPGNRSSHHKTDSLGQFDHVVLFDDETKEMSKEIVRCDGLGRTYMALDYFDVSQFFLSKINADTKLKRILF